jgi:hypothetical protein
MHKFWKDSRQFSTRLLAAFFAVLTLMVAERAVGQEQPMASRSRPELEARAAAAERAANAGDATAEVRSAQRAEAARIRARLRDGDFRPGDLIVVSIEQPQSIYGTDSLFVQEGSIVRFAKKGEVSFDSPISLVGVLRSELEAHLTRELGRWVNQPKLRARPYVKLSMLGAVSKPGWHNVPGNVPLSEAIMLGGGGVSSKADYEASTIRRGTTELLGEGELARVLDAGMTVDQLGLVSYDEITIAEEADSKSKWDTVQKVGILLSFIIGLYGTARIIK